MSQKIIVFCLLILLSGEGYGQEGDFSFRILVHKATEFTVGGIGHTFSDRSNQKIMGSVSLLTLGALSIDDRVMDYARNQGLLPANLARFGDLYGGQWAHWVLFSTIVATGVVQKDSREITLSRMGYASLALLTNGVATDLLKRSVGRQRPDKSDHRSFPSGHTSHSFTVATVFNELYGPKIGVPAYLVATIVAISRINDNKHYLSDVVFGAGLGTVIGRGFALQYRKQYLTITPSVRNGLLLGINIPL